MLRKKKLRSNKKAAARDFRRDYGAYYAGDGGYGSRSIWFDKGARGCGG